MAPFHVTYEAVPDERISDLLTITNAAGFPTPAMSPVGSSDANREQVAEPHSEAGRHPLDEDADLPDIWRSVRKLKAQSYMWPVGREHYRDYTVFVGETDREGAVHVALGVAPGYQSWGRARIHVVAFLTGGSPQIPLAEFIGTDDYAETGDLVAVIRGRGEPKSKKMFGPGDPLPRTYAERFRTALYNDHIRAPGAWSKVALLVHQDQHEAMLNHALLQARRRGDLAQMRPTPKARRSA